MKRLMAQFCAVILIALLALPVQAQGVSVLSSASASAEPRGDGLYYLVLAGDPAFIGKVCAAGDCARGFSSRLDALNYWTSLMNIALNTRFIPIPAPPAGVSRGTAAQLTAFEGEVPAGFAWIAECQWRDWGQQLHIWVGYRSDVDRPDSYLAYTGNGPGIYMDTPLAGLHERVVDVLLPTDEDHVQLFLYPEDIGLTIDAHMDLPECPAF